MSQSNNQYRLFFKKLTNLGGRAISSSQLRVTDFTLNRDLLTKAVSTFTVLQIPNAMEIGDVIGLYDAYGTILFLGVVTQLKDNVIEAGQMYEIFDDTWYWNNPKLDTIELTLQKILKNDFQQNNDTLMQSIFGVFDINVLTSTKLTLESQESQYTTNFASFLYDIYEKYSILLTFNIPYGEEKPTIDIGYVSYEKNTISNNALIFRNFDIKKETYETNKLIVYGEENSEYRGTWYTTSSGITDNSSALNRIQKIKTNIIFSDDDLSILKASSLRNEIYNHEISLDLVKENNLLNFSDLKLGQGVNLYYNSLYYDTILTGYKITLSNNAETGIVNLKFGLVRTTLTSKLFKRLNR